MRCAASAQTSEHDSSSSLSKSKNTSAFESGIVRNEFQKTVCRTSLPLKAAPAVVPCECRRVFSIRQQPFREQLLFLPLSLRLIPFLMESHILKLVIFSQPMLFRTDTNIAFQKVGILFVYVRTVLLNLSTERRTCLSLFR